MTPPNETQTFDPDEFINSTVEGSFSTLVAMCPEGTYRAQISPKDKWEGRIVETKAGPRRILRVPFYILDEAVKAELERETVSVPHDFWLDTDESGALDKGKGKNVDLGRLREALGQNNDPNWSLGKIADQMLTVKVEHRPDSNNRERKYAEVTRFAGLA